jgi:ABC-type multidrug transport system fused ATPase/permease subunit
MRALAMWLLDRVGLDPRSAGYFLSDLDDHRRLLMVALSTSLLAPLAELGFLGALFTMIEPATQSRVFNRLRAWGLSVPLEPAGDAPLLLALVGVVLLCATLACRYSSGVLNARFREAVIAAQSHRIVEAVMYAPPHRSGEIDRNRIASMAISEAGKYGGASYALLELLSSGTAMLGFLVTALIGAPVLAGVSAGLAAFTMAMSRWGKKRRRAIVSQRIEAEAAVMGGLWEILNGYQTLKMEGGERRWLRRFRGMLANRHDSHLTRVANELVVKLSTEGAVSLALLAFVFLAVAVLDLASSLLLVFLIMMFRMQKYVRTFQQSWIDLQYTMPILLAMSEMIERYRVLDRPVTPEKAGPRPDAVHLRFDDVSFEYEPGVRVIAGLTLDLPPGERVLIQGPSGHGKSTLLYLACGLLAPTRGRVLVNGEPLTADRFYRLRPFVAYVAPDTYLFAGSVRENLCLGIDYSDEAIAEAIARARLEELIARLPGGLDGAIGEDGDQLSLGERQRVMLSRIFLKRPLLVLLDESTANLDLDNERVILSSLLGNLDPLATVVVVTHRAPEGVAFTRSYDLSGGSMVERAANAPTAVSR